MRITVLTLFPNIINEYLKYSIIKNAIDKKICEIQTINFRNFSKDKHNKVDDYQFGGGAGMVLMIEPIVEAIRSCKKNNSKVILLTPTGKKFNNKYARELSKEEDIILIAGHYEGFDERIVNYIDEEISIGDYVLTGGEIPALTILDSIVRLLPNVIKNESLSIESFEGDLLDYPVYTKPLEFEGLKVPEILLTGHHKKIEEFRNNLRIEKTKKNRIDLYKKYIEKKGKKYE